MKHRIILVVGTAVGMLSVFTVAANIYHAAQVDKINRVAQQNEMLLYRDYAPQKGSDQAVVKLVEFLDPECKACGAFAPHFKSIYNDYKDHLKVYVRYVPFHGSSEFAIKILEASREQNRFWDVLEKLFATQEVWASHHHPQPEKIWDYLVEIGVDIDKIKSDMENEVYMERLEQDTDDGDALGVNETPTFFVNGKLVREWGHEPLRALIESEIRAAQK